jgi:hypothetical protein
LVGGFRTLGRPPAEENYKLINQLPTLWAEGASIRAIAITLKRSSPGSMCWFAWPLDATHHRLTLCPPDRSRPQWSEIQPPFMGSTSSPEPSTGTQGPTAILARNSANIAWRSSAFWRAKSNRACSRETIICAGFWHSRQRLANPLWLGFNSNPRYTRCRASWVCSSFLPIGFPL